MGDFFTEDFKLDLIELLERHKILPGKIARNEKINIRYRILKRELKNGKLAREKLADENCTSIKNIESILYPKKKENYL